MTTKRDPAVDVAVLGAAAVDWIARVKELPRRDGIVFVDEYKSMPGGTGGNVAEALARLGKQVRFFGKFGDDDGGRFLLQTFKEAGVDTRGTTIASGQRTASCFIAIDAQGERQIYCLGGSAIFERADELDFGLMKGIKALLIADVYLDVALKAIASVKQHAKIIFNPGGVMASSGEGFLKPIMEKSDVLIVSQVEAEIITRKSDPREGILNLADMGAKVIMITQGAAGVLLFEAGRTFSVPAYSVERVVDTTGAGDAFTAGVIAGAVEGTTWTEAARLGCAVSAIKIAHLGARGGLPDRNQVRLRMQEN